MNKSNVTDISEASSEFIAYLRCRVTVAKRLEGLLMISNKNSSAALKGLEG